MIKIINFIDKTNELLGKCASWLAIVMMISQVFSVISRYVFSYGIISVQEAVIYCHSILFLFGAAYILQTNEHVRVDVIYEQLSRSKKKIVNCICLVLFVIPVTGFLLWVSFPYMVNAWATLEGSRQAGGIPAVFILKTGIFVFALSIFLQAISILIRMSQKSNVGTW